MSEGRANAQCPVSNLQTMLLTICASEHEKTNLTADGVYGQETASQISRIQKRHGMPVTGITDESTWQTVREDYEGARLELCCAEALQIPLECGEVIRQGEYHPVLLIAQAVLTLLSESCENFSAPEITGTLDLLTEQALEAVQMMGDLPVTGQLDKKTWKLLAAQFPICVCRIKKKLQSPESDCYRM